MWSNCSCAMLLSVLFTKYLDFTVSIHETKFGTSALNPGTKFLRIFTVNFDRLGEF